MRNWHVSVTPNYRPHKFLGHWSFVIGHYLFSAFLRVLLPLCGCILALHTALAASTNDLASALQKGLFEEEANHNFPAAIEAYQSVINRFDEDRKLAATAIFRVGEIYRKQGKTNEANAQYERVVREFSDQSQLATLSQSYLAVSPALASNASTTKINSESAPTSDESEEVRKIRALIRDSPDLINATDSTGNTRLHDAASAGQVVVARFLIENGADVNAQNSVGSTPLHHAATRGHKALVELLLDHGANAQLADSTGYTPLHGAARRGFRSIIEVLLAHGADVNAITKSGSTPLHLAIANGFKSVAESLLSHQADVSPVTSEAPDDQQRKFNGTALQIAAARDDQPIAELLLANKANSNATNSTGDTALHVAASHGNRKMIELLLANKANVDALNKQGETPLDYAARSGQTIAVETLVRHGANVNARNPVEGPIKDWTPLLHAAANRHNDTVVLLLKRGANPNASIASGGSGWNKGATPLLMAVLHRVPDVVASLLDAKADPNVKDEPGVYPAHAALSISDAPLRKRILASLLDHGANTEISSDNDGRTLLMRAIGETFNKDDVELLLAHKANVNAQTPYGATPLHFLVSVVNQGPYERVAAIAELLMSAGANVNLQNNQGRTPLNQLLIEPKSRGINSTQSDMKLAELLRSHGALADLPRLDVIEVRRSDANYSKVIFTKGTNGWDQFTLYELIAVQYRILSAKPEGENLQPLENLIRDNRMPFPDFTRIRIRHPKPDFKNWAERNVDIADALSSGDCSTDVPLELGDQVEIPEADHVLGAEWPGLAKESVGLQKCLTRQVSIIVKGKSNSVTLKTGFLPRDNDTSPVAIASFMIRPVLLNSKLLLSSSDLSRVKLIRTDRTGQKRELIVDCTGDKSWATPNARPGLPTRLIVPGQQAGTPAPDSAPSVWLRDGDIIEVPDKP